MLGRELRHDRTINSSQIVRLLKKFTSIPNCAQNVTLPSEECELPPALHACEVFLRVILMATLFGSQKFLPLRIQCSLCQNGDKSEPRYPWYSPHNPQNDGVLKKSSNKSTRWAPPYSSSFEIVFGASVRYRFLDASIASDDGDGMLRRGEAESTCPSDSLVYQNARKAPYTNPLYVQGIPTYPENGSLRKGREAKNDVRMS